MSGHAECFDLTCCLLPDVAPIRIASNAIVMFLDNQNRSSDNVWIPNSSTAWSCLIEAVDSQRPDDRGLGWRIRRQKQTFIVPVSLRCRERTLDDIRSICCPCKIFTCINFLVSQQVTSMAPTVDYFECARVGCHTRVSKSFHRRLDAAGETLWYCSAEHKQEDRKRCEWNRNVRTRVHQQAAAPQAMKTVARMNSNSAALGQPLITPAAVGNDVAYILTS